MFLKFIIVSLIHRDEVGLCWTKKQISIPHNLCLPVGNTISFVPCKVLRKLNYETHHTHTHSIQCGLLPTSENDEEKNGIIQVLYKYSFLFNPRFNIFVSSQIWILQLRLPRRHAVFILFIYFYLAFWCVAPKLPRTHPIHMASHRQEI